MLQHFSDKWAIVSGVGLKNMGSAIALALSKNGVRLVLIGYNMEEIMEVAKEVEGYSNYTPVYLGTDFYDMNSRGIEAYREFIESLRREVPEIHILIHAAGFAEVAGFLETNDELYNRTFTINVSAPFFLTQEIIRSGLMKEGVIINISSTVGEPTHGWSGGIAYSMSKSAFTIWSQMIAHELAPKIRVNTILPGSIDTPMAAKLLGDEGKKAMAGSIPLKRLGKPEEVASVVLELIGNPYLSGTEIRVDGARTVGS